MQSFYKGKEQAFGSRHDIKKHDDLLLKLLKMS